MNPDLENRYCYHPPMGDQPVRYARIRASVKQLAYLLTEVCPQSRELATALTHLDATMFFANAAVARHLATTPPAVIASSADASRALPAEDLTPPIL